MTGAPILSAQPDQRRRLRPRAALLAELESDLLLVERVAVLLAAGFNRSEIAVRLRVDPKEVDRARRTLKTAAERLQGRLGERAFDRVQNLSVFRLRGIDAAGRQLAT